MMLQSLKRALKLNVDDARLGFSIARFQNFVEKNAATMAAPVKQVSVKLNLLTLAQLTLTLLMLT